MQYISIFPKTPIYNGDVIKGEKGMKTSRVAKQRTNQEFATRGEQAKAETVEEKIERLKEYKNEKISKTMGE